MCVLPFTCYCLSQISLCYVLSSAADVLSLIHSLHTLKHVSLINKDQDYHLQTVCY